MNGFVSKYLSIHQIKNSTKGALKTISNNLVHNIRQAHSEETM